MTHPDPTFEDDNYSNTSVWPVTNDPASYAADLYNPSKAINGGTGSATYVTRTPGIVVSGDTAVTFAMWWRGTDMTSETSTAMMMAQADTNTSIQYFYRVAQGATSHGRLQLFMADGGASANSIQSSSSTRFDDDTWYLLMGRGNGTDVDLFFVTEAITTLTEVAYTTHSTTGGTGFTSFGGTTSNLVTGEDLQDPGNDQLFGLNSRPRIWKNQFLSNAQLQDFATEQLALINDDALNTESEEVLLYFS